MVSNFEVVCQCVQVICELGVQVVIDDFGSGFSNLFYFKSILVDIMKIDCFFICSLVEDEVDQVIVLIIIYLVYQLGFSVVVEGVESECIVKILYYFGCDFVQGYVIVWLMLVEELEEWLGMV